MSPVDIPNLQRLACDFRSLLAQLQAARRSADHAVTACIANSPRGMGNDSIVWPRGFIINGPSGLDEDESVNVADRPFRAIRLSGRQSSKEAFVAFAKTAGRLLALCPEGINEVACLGNPDPVGMKVYCPTGKETFDDEKTEEAPPRRDRGEAA